MKLCFIGKADATAPRNTVNLKALQTQGWTDFLYIDQHVTIEKISVEQDLSGVAMIKRILRRLRLFPELVRHINELRMVKAIVVGYPGHLDVPIAFIFAKLLHKPLIFDPVIILSSAFADDVGAISGDSLSIKAIKFAEKIIYSLPDMILAETPHQKEYFERVFGVKPEKITVVPLGTDETIYQYRPLTPKEKRACTVFYYGVYNPIHGVELILESAKELQKEPGITFYMVGKGKTYPEAKDFAEKNKLKNVIFYPDMTEKNALSTLQKANIFLGFISNGPSVKRAIPNKVYQGLALGKAVITADAPVIRSFFTHKHDIFVCTPGDAHSLTQAILELKNNPKLREQIADNGYTLFLQKFNTYAIGKSLVHAIIKAVNS